MEQSKPTRILDINFEANPNNHKVYILLRCEDGHIRRKVVSDLPEVEIQSLVETFADFRQNQAAVIFRSAGNWSVNRWFNTFEELDETEIVEVNEDVTIVSNVDTDKLKSYVAAIKYALKRFKLSDVGIDISIRRSLPQGNQGRAFIISRVAKDFGVEVSDQGDFEETLNTIFHELRHVSQWDKGVLLGSVWKGNIIDRDKIKYNDWPWEVDARKAADIMVKDFQAMLDSTGD